MARGWSGTPRPRVFRQFGAAPALAEVEALMRERADGGRAGRRRPHVAGSGGASADRARKDESRDRRRARHQREDGRAPRQQIFTKLDLSTRAAATAYAFTHRLAP